MTNNINQALQEIKSHEGVEQLKLAVGDIKGDLQEGTRQAMKNRVKIVKKDKHLTMKIDMKSIFAKQPLIVRKDWKVPVYPKLDFS